jgi:hypothetical protein
MDGGVEGCLIRSSLILPVSLSRVSAVKTGGAELSMGDRWGQSWGEEVGEERDGREGSEGRTRAHA